MLGVVIACGGGDDASSSANTGGRSSGGAAGSSSGGSSGMAGSGGVAGTPGCPAGTHSGPNGCEATLAGWSVGPSIAKERDHHLTFAAKTSSGSFVYATGGVQNESVALISTERAAIQADGSLASWTTDTSLLEPVIGGGVAQVGDVVVVTAGIRAGEGGKAMLSSKTETTRVLPDGKLAAFASGPLLSETRFHHASAAHGSFVYVIGGLTGEGSDNTPGVERATVGNDGTLAPWQTATALPEKRSHHATVVHGDSLYVIGGLSGDPAGAHTNFANVLRSAIAADGSLGAWTEVGELPTTLTTHAAFVLADFVYVVGGIEDSSMNTDHVRRAPIQKDGTVGTWESLEALPGARAHAHQTPLLDGFVYSVAGALNHVSLADVFVGRFE